MALRAGWLACLWSDLMLDRVQAKKVYAHTHRNTHTHTGSQNHGPEA